MTTAPAAPISFDRNDLEVEGDLGGFSLILESEQVEEGLTHVTLTLSSPAPATPPRFSIRWKTPSVDVAGFWTPKISLDKASYYNSGISSRAAVYAPVITLYNSADTNRLTWACSDGLRSLSLVSYVKEEDAHFHNVITFFGEASAAITEYRAVLRFDTRPMPFHEALGAVSRWWAAQEGYEPAPVPPGARVPLYSTWYSFHQDVTDKAVLGQLELAGELGFGAVIVDDGWQTLDSSRGYAYTGDWEPVRIPRMKEFVERAHELGMKFMLWYSLPFIGEKSANFQRFEGKYLWRWESQGAWVLDPRFPEVREFIIGTYVDALERWDLDGFKLDFLGRFRPDENTVFEAVDGRDFASIDEAVDRLMTDIMMRLRRIKPDILIEFRQPYIGPLMRKYGNMFRATDCPNEALVNRVRTTDLRLLSGGTAVHSDMYMWHNDDPVEVAALQLLNVLFAVPQLSVRLDQISEDHRRMVGFWTEYWNSNKDILLDGRFVPVNPAANYPLIMAIGEDKTIAAAYNDVVVPVHSELQELDIINAKSSGWIALDVGVELGHVTITSVDCTGNPVQERSARLGRGMHKLAVPPSGLISIRKR